MSGGLATSALVLALYLRVYVGRIQRGRVVRPAAYRTSIGPTYGLVHHVPTVGNVTVPTKSDSLAPPLSFVAVPVTLGFGSGQVVQVAVNVNESAGGRESPSLNRKITLTDRPTSAKGSVTTVQFPSGVGRASGAILQDDSSTAEATTAMDFTRIATRLSFATEPRARPAGMTGGLPALPDPALSTDRTCDLTESVTIEGLEPSL